MDGSNTRQEIRYAKACNPCRRKKTRCDGRRPVCSSCSAFGDDCSFNDVVKSKRRRANHGYIRELEGRLKDLEGQLESERPNRDSSADPQDAERSPRSPYGRDDGQRYPNTEPIPEIDNKNTREGSDPSYLVTNPHGDMRFFGPSSGFSIISDPGVRWVEHQTRNRNYRHTAQKIMRHSQLTNWVPRPLQDDFSRRQTHSIPPKAEALALVEDFFKHTNAAFPLFNRESFFKRIEKHYSWNPDDNPAWWASFNVVLAFSERRKVDINPEHSDGRQAALGYVKNALNVVVELFLRKTELLAVQAIVALALYFQDTPNPQPLFMFSAAAIRMAQSIGLHKSGSFGLAGSQIEERRNTFWIAFILDADICQRTGRPPVQHADDYDIELPREFPENSKGVLHLKNSSVQFNFFNSLSRFALLQRKVYDRIYTSRGLRKPSAELLHDITTCEEELQAWKMSIPSDYRPRRNFLAPSEPMLLHVLRLHFAFHSCQAKLHRMFTVSGRSMNQQSESSDNTVTGNISIAERCEKSTTTALEAARASVELLEQAKSFGSTFAWSFLYFPAAAVPTLFAHLLMDPFHDQAQPDLEMIHQVVEFLTQVSSEEEDTYADYLLELCRNFEVAATQMRQQPVNASVGNITSGSNIPGVASNTTPMQWNSTTDTATAQFSGVNNITGEYLEDAGQPGLPWNWQDMAGIPPLFGADPLFGFYMPDL
ncbi:hypothetical protein AWENTII_005635 [Aspergillus wentii]